MTTREWLFASEETLDKMLCDIQNIIGDMDTTDWHKSIKYYISDLIVVEQFFIEIKDRINDILLNYESLLDDEEAL